jgi:hypothetical protein
MNLELCGKCLISIEFFVIRTPILTFNVSRCRQAYIIECTLDVKLDLAGSPSPTTVI